MFEPPLSYIRIKVVQSFHELITTPYRDGINALCWPRTLPGSFREVIGGLGTGEGIVTVDESCLEDLPLSNAGKVARDRGTGITIDEQVDDSTVKEYL